MLPLPFFLSLKITLDTFSLRKREEGSKKRGGVKSRNESLSRPLRFFFLRVDVAVYTKQQKRIKVCFDLIRLFFFLSLSAYEMENERPYANRPAAHISCSRIKFYGVSSSFSASPRNVILFSNMILDQPQN